MVEIAHTVWKYCSVSLSSFSWRLGSGDHLLAHVHI